MGSDISNKVLRYGKTTPFSMRFKLKKYLWLLINRSIFRFIPPPFIKPRLFLLRIFGASIHSSANVARSAVVSCPWNLVMGKDSSICDGAWVDNLTTVELEDNAIVGQQAVILTGTHNIFDATYPLVLKPVKLEYGVWVTTRCIILPGVSIGPLTVVGAGSVVVRSIPGGMVYAGNPAIELRKREIE